MDDGGTLLGGPRVGSGGRRFPEGLEVGVARQPRMGKANEERVQVEVRRLHPGQVRIAEDPARFKVVMCGRRFGKTAMGIRLAMDVALKGDPVGWFTPTYKYATEVWRELTRRLGPAIEKADEREKRIDLHNGGSLEIWTLDGTEDPARGRFYRRVVVDEAGLVPGLLSIWTLAIRPTLTDLAGDALILGTPKGRRHGFVQLFGRGDSPTHANWASFRARTLDNPHIPPDEVAEARRDMTPEQFAQEYEGIPMDDGANPFGLQAVGRAFERGKPFEGEGMAWVPTKPVVYGLDLARREDFTVLVGLDSHRRVVKLERWQAPWADTKTRVRALCGGVPIVADATGVGDAIVADLQAMGCNVTPHVFSQPSKLRLMQRLIAAFQGEQLTIPPQMPLLDGRPGPTSSQWLRAELEAFEFVETASGVRYEAPRGQHDDGVMALALALYGWDRVQGEVPEPPRALVFHGDDPHVGMEADAMRSREMLYGGMALGNDGNNATGDEEPLAAYIEPPRPDDLGFSGVGGGNSWMF